MDNRKMNIVEITYTEFAEVSPGVFAAVPKKDTFVGYGVGYRMSLPGEPPHVVVYHNVIGVGETTNVYHWNENTRIVMKSSPA